MNLVVIVAGDIFTEFFEVAAFADLPLGVHAEGAPIQKQGRQIFPLMEQVRVNTDLGLHRNGFAHRPEAAGRTAFQVRGVEPVIAPLERGAGPDQPRPFALRG